MFNLAVSIASVIMEFNVSGFICANFYTKTYDRNKYLYICICLVLGLISISTIIFCFTQRYIAIFLSIPGQWLWLILPTAGSQAIFAVIMTVLQMHKKPAFFVAFQFVQMAISSAVALFLVIEMDLGWRGRAMGQCCASVICAVMGVLLVSILGLATPNKIKRENLVSILRFSAPLMPHTLSVYISTAIDRVFLANFIGLTNTGIYTLGSQIGQLINVLESAFNQAWTPWLFERLAKDDEVTKKRIVRITYLYFLLILIVAVSLGVLAPWILKFIASENYNGASIVIMWAALAGAFSGMYKMVVGYLIYTKKVGGLSMITVSTIVIQTGLIFYLGSQYGMKGVAAATALAGLFKFLAVWSVSALSLPMPWLGLAWLGFSVRRRS